MQRKPFRANKKSGSAGHTLGESVNSVRRAVGAAFETDVRFSKSPLLTGKTPAWRSHAVMIGLALCFVGLAVKAAKVQVLEHDFYQKKGDGRLVRTIELPAKRGRIWSRDNTVLADNAPAISVWAMAEEARAASTGQLEQLAHVLEMPVAELKARLQKGSGFLWLKRKLDLSKGPLVEKLQIKGIYSNPDSKRIYPGAEVAAQLVGFVDPDGRGVEGVESGMDAVLVGSNGERRVLRDAFGRIVEDAQEPMQPRDGQDVTLTIDHRVQTAAYAAIAAAVQKHRAISGSVVVLEVASGEVLAMANYPSYDPGSIASAPGSRIKSLLPQMRNRAVADVFEPGSVIKPLSISLALDRGIVRPDTVFQTAPGFLQLGNRKIRDSHAHGALTVEQIVQKSSNVGTVKITAPLAEQTLWQHYSNLGFGQKPQLGLKGVRSGSLRAARTWGAIGKATQSYGYGLSISLVQLAQAYGALADDGLWRSMQLIKAPNHALQPSVEQRLVSAKTAQQMRSMLHKASGPGGTAPLAQIEGFTVGGKTGTTHKTDAAGQYSPNRYRSTFVGMSPVQKPRVIIAVTIDEPRNGQHYGGEVAAPVFATVVSDTLRLLGAVPDKSVRPLYDLAAVEESIE